MPNLSTTPTCAPATPRKPSTMSRFTLPAILALAALVVLSVLLGSWYTVDQTERVVLLRNGAFVSVEEPGLHFKAPWIESVVKIGTYQRTDRWGKSEQADDRQEAYSQDQQPAQLSVSVLWHVPPGSVDKLYQQYRSAEGAETNLLDRRVPQAIKTVFGQFTAVSAIQDRAKLNAQVFDAVTKDADITASPVVVDGVQVEDISFSSAYVQSVEAAMQARVEVQKLEQQQQQQEVQARITVINAKAAADAKVAQAQADAQATRLRGEAEADAIKARGDALRNNPDLVALTAAEKWNGTLPTTMVPGAAVPFVAVK